MPLNKLMPAKRLILSYIFDWIVIITIAAIGAAFNAPGPYKRPFSLVDLTLSYPDIGSQISTTLLVILSLVVPAVFISLVCVLFVPGPTVSPNTPKPLVWRRKFWEWNTGWMGLALSLALAFFFTQGMKNLFGKPRPNLLAICDPDPATVGDHIIGNFGHSFNPEWVLVNASICRQSDKAKLDDAFRSFPSGHASMSWSGLLYLAFFFCSKFAISIPFLHSGPFSHGTSSILSRDSPMHPEYVTDSVLPLHNSDHIPAIQETIPLHNQAASPPNHLLIIPMVPLSAAIYITATRYFQFHHHGFDILVGSLVGIASSWFSFRWYHLPIRQGSGWSWGARSRDRAWFVPVGVESYVEREGWSNEKRGRKFGTDGNSDVLGPDLNGHGNRGPIASKEDSAEMK